MFLFVWVFVVERIRRRVEPLNDSHQTPNIALIFGVVDDHAAVLCGNVEGNAFSTNLAHIESDFLGFHVFTCFRGLLGLVRLKAVGTSRILSARPGGRAGRLLPKRKRFQKCQGVQIS
jgi:hypothetical protein